MEEAFFDSPDALIDQVEKSRAGIRTKVERQFGFVKFSYRGLTKNTLHLTTLFALSNLWIARHNLVEMQA